MNNMLEVDSDSVVYNVLKQHVVKQLVASKGKADEYSKQLYVVVHLNNDGYSFLITCQKGKDQIEVTTTSLLEACNRFEHIEYESLQ